MNLDERIRTGLHDEAARHRSPEMPLDEIRQRGDRRRSVRLLSGSRPRPLLAPLLGATAILDLIGVVAWMARPAAESLLGTEPTSPPSSVAPTTLAPPPPLGAVELPAFTSELPRFRGEIRLSGGLMRVSYAGAGLGFRVDLVESLDTWYPGPFTQLIEGGPGSSLVFDGAQLTTHNVRDDIVQRSPLQTSTVGYIDWRHEPGVGSLCSQVEHLATGVELVAGRFAQVVTCTGLGEDVTAWVDHETGLILRLENAQSPGLFGGYEFETIDYAPIFEPGTFVASDPGTATVIDGAADVPPVEEEWGPDRIRESLQALANDMFGSNSDLRRSEPPPPLTGSLLDGSSFDLTHMVGEPVLLHFWWALPRTVLEWGDAARDYNFTKDSLAAEVAALDRWGDQLVIVSVAVGRADTVRTIIELADHPVDGISVLIPDGQTVKGDCDCPVVWRFPFQPGNTWILIGDGGEAVDAFYQLYPTMEGLEIFMEINGF